jgi:outer membrane protein OmpA-like peptidoglycan-associated protein
VGDARQDHGRGPRPSRRTAPARTPAHETPAVPGPAAHAELLRLQATAGNATVARALGVQRQPAPAPGVTPVIPAPPLRTFPETRFIHGGPRFDLQYDPVGPLPAVGRLKVTLKVHVEFKDFDRSMMRQPEFRRHRWTRAQLGQFGWPADKKREWVGKFSRAVADGWKDKHAFVLDEPGFAQYRAPCDVQVQPVGRPEEANTRITAQWVPPGAPRLRSSVSGGGSTGQLDARDVDEPETHTVPAARLVRQIGPFDLDSAVLTPTVMASINDFEAAVRRQRQPGRPLAGPIDDLTGGFTGRASSPGPIAHNQRLGMDRANAVSDRVMDDLGLSMAIAHSVGETHASADPSFQRVDASVAKGTGVEVHQNVAAHEAGHMFGLGDEYVEEVPPKDVTAKFEGDRPSHDADVRTTMGDEAADELLVQNSGSMMSSGSEVKPGHYVYFLQALNSVTGHSWRVE